MINRLKSLSPEFRKVLKDSSLLADSLKFSIYLVGGIVRDLILGRSVFDLDIVVEGDAIVFVQKLAGQLNCVFKKHHSFGTATLYFKGHKIDFATARTEKYSHWGALPKVKPAVLARDLFRRDFTINAMAISLNKDNYGALIDLYNGLYDLEEGLIRILHEKSFLEDPTRILRAIRFEQRFSFKFEAGTFKLLAGALDSKALKFVNPHRLRDELVLILEESKPYRYIKRINELAGFSFLDERIRLDKESFRFFLRAERAISYYQKNFKKHGALQAWLIYLAGILLNLHSKKILNFFHDFGLRKKERATIISIKEGIRKIKRLNKRGKPHHIYQILQPHSFESILFFYAYYPEKNLRKNIDYFLDELIDINLKIKGHDLKELGLSPLVLYGRLFKKLLHVKITKGLKTKKEEIEEAKRIFKLMRG